MKRLYCLAGVLFLGFVIGFNFLKASREIQISVVGDVLLDRGVGKSMQHNSAAYPYIKVSRYFKKDDITIGNLECPITSSGTAAVKKKSIVFKADPSNTRFLKKAGFDVLDLANNHSMDQGSTGLYNTMKNLNTEGLKYFGAGINKKAAEKPLYITKNGITMGLLGFSEFPPEGYFSIEGRPDISYLDVKRINSIIKLAKRHCDILIIMFHWGVEFCRIPTELQQSIARMACDSGGDFIIGDHPHVLQSIEKYKGKYIFYSLGNFVFDKQLYPHTDESGILKFTVKHKKISNIKLIPIKIVNSQPEPANNQTAHRIYDYLVKASQRMGCDMKFNNSKIEIQ